MNQQKIGRFISECRKQKGLTQAQLAEALGVSDKSVSRWENGKTMPDLSIYEPLCEILDIQISELLYARKMTDKEKTIQGEKSALNIFKTKSQLQTFAILTVVCGCFVWGFGLVLRVKIRKAISLTV